MNLYPITIIQNFYDNPDEIRRFALSQNYQYCHEKIDNYGFPGCRTEELRKIDSNLYESLCRKLISVFHDLGKDPMRWEILTSFQIVEEKYDRGLIHQDGNVVFAGIIYLSPDAPLNSGTSIFRKNSKFNQTTYDEAMLLNDEMLKSNQQSSYDYHEMFDEVVTVNNVYNSLILFEGDTYHAANKFFGASKNDARLTQTFFVTRVDAQQYNVFPGYRFKQIKI